MLQEVQIATGSQLQLIEQEAFDSGVYLQPVDVPSAATIRGRYDVMASVYDQDGSARTRVQFPKPRMWG
jgi:hypothetical protein